ncbi:Oligopeptide transport system permease protein OppC [Paraliobacillus sp. PM-2]|uniref:oligopeptide ABC transporter permease n=1 Tax=Paraliobacillus sp. PM-2 TaxID=1462524 RepID=UPI00061BB42F|nr:oligopeptide ABC transporter permease [Paraliobacillus sp. PM-2]CQR46983.1 Oligopeptide transport system permease protein OppC [Paraliobacillus sp. PM-2]
MDKENVKKDLFVPAQKDEEKSEQINRPSLSFWQDAWIRLRKNGGAIFGMVTLVLLTLLAIFAPMLTSHGLDDQDLGLSRMPPKVQGLENFQWLGLDGKKSETFEADSVEEAKDLALARFSQDDFSYIEFDVKAEGDGSEDSAEVKAYYDPYADKQVEEYFWFGTDTLGRDLFTRVWIGTRISLMIALIAALIDMLVGVAYGGISGYFGGRVDNIMQRIIEVLVGIPNLVVVILMIMILDPGITAIIIALTITGWTGMARIVRGQVLKLKNQEFVLASQTLGSSNTRILTKHLIPNTVGMIIINTMFTIPNAIFFEAFLSFIGLGLQAPDASLGTLINDGFKALQINPHIMIFPAIVMSLIMIGFNILADGLRDALDPKMRE